MQSIPSRFALAAAAAFSLLLGACATGPGGTYGMTSSADARAIDAKSRAALDRLYQSNPSAAQLGGNSVGILVFPEIVKGGFLVGGGYGDGAFFQRNKPTGYYRSISASYGLQAGLQKYGYALFLMDETAVRALNRSEGWELGSEPNLVVLDQGVSASLSTTTANQGTYAVAFDHRGLMAGLGLQGTKITALNIKP